MRGFRAAGISFVIALIGCESSTQTTVSSASGRLAGGKDYLAKGYYRPAIVEFEAARKAGLDSETTCQAHYGFGIAMTFQIASDLLVSAGGVTGTSTDLLDSFGFVPRAGPRHGGGAGSGPDGRPGPESPGAASPPRRAPSRVAREEQGNTDTIIPNILDPLIEQFVKPVDEALSTAAEMGCSFRTGPQGIPLSTGLESTIWIGEEFDEVYARLVSGTLRALRGAAAVMTAHDLQLDLYGLEDLPVQIEGETDLIGILRLLGTAVTSSPTFLDFSAQRGSRITEARVLLAGGLEQTASGLSALFSGKEKLGAGDNVLGYVDFNENGRVDGGDQLWVGVLRAEPELEFGGDAPASLPINLASADFSLPIGDLGAVPIGLFLFTLFGDPFPKNAVQLLGRLRENILGEGDLLNLAEFNVVAPFGLEILPNTIALDLSRWAPSQLADARPLRAMLPVWGSYDPPGGDGTYLGDAHPIFLIEGELGKNAARADTVQEVEGNDPEKFCHTCLPGARFSTGVYGESAGLFRVDPELSGRLSAPIQSLPDDCIAADKTTEFSGFEFPLPYTYWQDPTMNGSLFANLFSITHRDCAAADAAYVGTDPADRPVPRGMGVPATNYSLNKAQASFLTDLLRLANLSSFSFP